MTIPSTTRRAGPYYGTGALVGYSFSFKAFDKADIRVVVANAAGVESELVVDSSALVTLNPDQDAVPGGSVQYAVAGVATALPVGYSLVILSGLAYAQGTRLPTGGNYRAEVVEQGLDALSIQIQQLREILARTLTLSSLSSDSVSAALPLPDPSRVLGWNESGTGLTNMDPGVLAAIVAFGTAQGDVFTGDGVTTVFSLSQDPATAYNLDVSVAGVTKVPGIDYTWSAGTTITFTAAPAVNAKVYVRYMRALPQASQSIPSVTGQTGKVLSNDGVALAWADSSVAFAQGGAGTATRVMQDKVREISVSITDFSGHDATGATASDTAFAAAYNYLASLGAGGGFLDIPTGTFSLAASHTLPTGVIVRGIGKRRTTLLRKHTDAAGMFVMGSYSGFRDLTIDGGNNIGYTTGDGCVFPTNKPAQVFFNVEVRRFNNHCLRFEADGGSGFKSFAGDYVTSGAVGSVAAVKVNGTDTQAIPRHFYGTESGGCTLFDFGGANNFFATGGYSAGLIFGTTCSKVELTNFRVGYSTGYTVVKGDSHSIVGVAFAEYVSIDSAATAILFECVVPDNVVNDNGSGNYVTIPGMPSYGCVWGADGSSPAIGNGSLAANYTRRGQMVEVNINFVAGSTTTFGTGDLTFSLPKLDNAYLTQIACGTAWISNGAGSSAAIGAVYIVPGGNKAKVNVVSGGGAANLQGTVPFALNTGSVIRMRFHYQTV